MTYSSYDWRGAPDWDTRYNDHVWRYLHYRIWIALGPVYPVRVVSPIGV